MAEKVKDKLPKIQSMLVKCVDAKNDDILFYFRFPGFIHRACYIEIIR